MLTILSTSIFNVGKVGANVAVLLVALYTLWTLRDGFALEVFYDINGSGVYVHVLCLAGLH